MLARLCLTVCAASLVFALLPSRANAQSLYYRSIPIGERAMGLGGAYTGVADDPSATYYNPAGLLSGGRFELLGSLSSIVWNKKKIERAFTVEGAARDLESTRTTTLPHFIGTVVKFGKKKFGDHRYGIAYSSFVLERQKLNAGFSQIAQENSTDLRLNDNYRMRWWGITFAMQVSKKLALGISTFLTNQWQGYAEDIGLAYGGTLDEDGVRTGGEFATSSTELSVNAWGLLFRLGALYRINPQWQIGVMFQPPGAPMKETGSIFRRFTTDEQGAEPTYFLFDEGGFEANLPIPFELRAGAEYKIDSLNTLTFDVALTGPIRSQEVIEVPADVPALGAYFSNSTKRRVTPNAAIGVEHLFGKVVVAGGLFTNISAAPNVPETSQVYTPPQVSTYAASFAVGVDTNGYRLTLGATGYFGRGDALAFTVDREAQVIGYRRTKANVSSAVLYIAGAVSVANKGAKQVQERLHERKGKEQGGDAGTDPDADAGAGAGAGAAN